MKPILVYTGRGAYQAKDIENFLCVFDFDYRRVSEHDFGMIEESGIFIVPGGEIKSILPAWKKKGINDIRKCVKDGGIYIGLCAGAYIAGEKIFDIDGLGFFRGSLDYQKRKAILDVTDQGGNVWQALMENGPDLSSLPRDRVILSDAQGCPQAIQITHGIGEVYLFAVHPEGSVFDQQFPQFFSGAKFFYNFLNSLCNPNRKKV